MYLRFEPLASRLIFVLIFTWLTSMSQREYEQCEDNIDAVSSLKNTNPCMDEYSQVNTKKIMENLESA